MAPPDIKTPNPDLLKNAISLSGALITILLGLFAAIYSNSMGLPVLIIVAFIASVLIAIIVVMILLFIISYIKSKKGNLLNVIAISVLCLCITLIVFSGICVIIINHPDDPEPTPTPNVYPTLTITPTPTSTVTPIVTPTVIFTPIPPEPFNNYIHVKNGTGVFSSISESNKEIRVLCGQSIVGRVNMEVYNNYPEKLVVPLICTPSWWEDHPTSWWPMYEDINRGFSTHYAEVNNKAPDYPGTYYLVFAFKDEKTSNRTASGTSSDVTIGITYDGVWNDGNDIADLTATQLAQAQQNGRTVHSWTTISGTIEENVAADAITIIVQ